MTLKIMHARRAGVCMHCGKQFDQGDLFAWDPQQYKGFCTTCPPTVTQVLTATPQQQSQASNSQTYRQDVANSSRIKTRIVTNTELFGQLTQMFDGHFTVPFRLPADAPTHRRHVTVWITTRGARSKYPGSRRIRVRHVNEYIDVGYVTKEGELHFYSLDDNPSFSALKISVIHDAVVLLIRGGNQHQFGMYWAMISSRCWRCGKKLTNPQTLKLTSGCGPVCDKIVEERGIDHSSTREPEPVIFGRI